MFACHFASLLSVDFFRLMDTPPFSALDLGFMQQAILLAKEAQLHGEVPVGAVLAMDGRVIAGGWNQPILTHDPTAHAEIQVLRKAGAELQNYRLPNSTLYVTLEPCMMCIGALCHARVGRIVFGASDPKRGATEGALQLAALNFLNHRIEVQGGLLGNVCSEVLQTFFQEKRNGSKSRTTMRVAIDRDPQSQDLKIDP